MKQIWILACILLTTAFQFSTAQETNTDAGIYGDVKSSGEHIPFVNITLDGTTIGTLTDASGHYYLNNLPIGTYTVRVSGIGYKSTTHTVTTAVGTTLEVNFEIEEDLLHMEEVVVSADRNQTNRSEAPVVITSISPSRFSLTQSVNMAEGLDFITGVRTEYDCQNCGFTQLRMNGLDGPYTQILVNSRPVFSGLAGVYGLELIPTNMVERIEVVRGGGSALFGGNAIAGTINVITKESKLNSFSLEGRQGVIGIGHGEGDAPSMDGQLSLNASVVTDDSNSGAYLYAMARNRDSFDENGDGFSEIVMIENNTFGFNAYHKPGIRSKISLDGYRINEFRRGGNKMDWLPHEADIGEQVEHLITGGNLAFDLFTNDRYDKLTAYAALQQVDRESYYGAMQDPLAYGHSEDLTSSVGGQYVINADKFLFATSTTVMGVDNTNNILHDRKLGANGEENHTLIRQMVNTLGTFIQQDWKSSRINFSLGFRVDNYAIRDLQSDTVHNMSDYSRTVLAPRLSMLYKATPNLRFRAGYAKGYRAPQLYNEDLHIELINARRVIHINDSELVQETSHSFTTSVNSNFMLGSSIQEILAEGFYTLLVDPFADQYYPLDEEGNWAYLRVNAEDGAYVTGVNLEWNSYWTDHFTSQAGLTIQKSRYLSPLQWGQEEGHDTDRFLRTPDAYGYATVDWHPVENLSLSLSANYTGSMHIPHFGLDPATVDPLERQALDNGDVIPGERLEISERFLVTDLLISYHLHLSSETTLQLYAGMKNMFNSLQQLHDSGMFRDAGYIYGPYQPRTINLGVRFGNIFD